jgi:hypothetical protein
MHRSTTSEVLVDPHFGVERHVFGQVADVSPEPDRILIQIHACYHHPTGSRRQEGGEHPHHGRLARAVGAQESEHLSLRHEEAQVPDHRLFDVGLAEVFNFNHRSRLLSVDGVKATQDAIQIQARTVAP